MGNPSPVGCPQINPLCLDYRVLLKFANRSPGHDFSWGRGRGWKEACEPFVRFHGPIFALNKTPFSQTIKRNGGRKQTFQFCWWKHLAMGNTSEEEKWNSTLIQFSGSCSFSCQKLVTWLVLWLSLLAIPGIELKAFYRHVVHLCATVALMNGL